MTAQTTAAQAQEYEQDIADQYARQICTLSAPYHTPAALEEINRILVRDAVPASVRQGVWGWQVWYCGHPAGAWRRGQRQYTLIRDPEQEAAYEAD